MRRLRKAQPWPAPVPAPSLPPAASERSELKDERFITAARRLLEAAVAQQRRACASGAGGGSPQLLRRVYGATRLQGDREHSR